MKVNIKIYIAIQIGIVVFFGFVIFLMHSDGELGVFELYTLIAIAFLASFLLFIAKQFVYITNKTTNKAKAKIDEKKEEPIVIDERITDVKKSTFAFIKENYLPHAIVILGFSIALFIYLSSLIVKFGIEEGEILVVPIFIPIVAYRFVHAKVYTVFMKQFAEVNGFKFYKKGDHAKETGSIFKKGRNKKMYNVAKGSFLNYPIGLFNYKFTVGSGKHKRTYKNTVFELNFKKQMPHLYLDTKGIRPVLSGWLKPISLESSRFNEEFTLYAKEGEHIPALQIFTPDVMVKLMDLPGKADIEFIGNKIYIYETKLVNTKKELEETFELAKYLAHNMDHVLKSMKYEAKAAS